MLSSTKNLIFGIILIILALINIGVMIATFVISGFSFAILGRKLGIAALAFLAAGVDFIMYRENKRAGR